jgi:hypothetical protein
MRWRRHLRRDRFNPDRDVQEWTGGTVPYDLVKEFVIALLVVGLIVVLASVLFSSPDERPVTLKQWSNADPVDFAQTAITELDGTSATATYGPPYNNASPASSQSLGPVSLESGFGVHNPVDTAQDFVISPLLTIPNDPLLRAAVARYGSAPSAQQLKWTSAYESGVAKATFGRGALRLQPGQYGPVAPMIGGLVAMARTGSLDGALMSSPQFYNTDYTKPLLFLSDGTYLADVAHSQHLEGSQWGMMNETGSFPGQAWLWLYTMWYQVSPFNSSGNADILVWALMMVLTLALFLVPFIPGLRSVPRWTRLYRLIWRRHYSELEESSRVT